VDKIWARALDRATLDRLLRYCLSLTAQRDDALDLLHNAVERVLKTDVSGIKAPEAFIRTTARNLFFDQYRRARRFPEVTMDEVPEVALDERALADMVVDQLTLRQVWAQLSAAERETVFLWAVDGLSATEIALQLGQPRGSVLSRLHRLRQRLRAMETGGQDHA